MCVLVPKKYLKKKRKRETDGRTECTQKRRANPEICAAGKKEENSSKAGALLLLSRKVGNARCAAAARIVGESDGKY